MPRRLFNLAGMLRAERRSLERLHLAQGDRLRALVRSTFERVPGYRDLWREHGVGPEDVQELADLARLPIVDKRYMREMGPDRFVDVRQAGGSDLLERHTSGSSGAPFRFFVDRDHDRWRKAQRLRPYVTNGLKPWHRTLTLSFLDKRRQPLPGLGWFAEHRVDVGRPPGELLRIVLDERPDVLMGYPSALGLLAAEYERSGRAGYHPSLVFTDSEVLTPGVRALVRDAFGTDPIDVYGTYETDNIAFQCHVRDGMHVAMESVIIEIVDDGRVIAPGAHGEVVVTVLRNRSMPFIRYNLHDESAYSTTTCTCGRTLPTLSAVRGRSDDQVTLPGGGRCSALPLLEAFDALSHLMWEYRVVQRTVGHFDVYLVPVEGSFDEARRHLRGVFQRHAPGSRVSFIECADTVPRRSSGKLSCFTSEVAE